MPWTDGAVTVLSTPTAIIAAGTVAYGVKYLYTFQNNGSVDVTLGPDNTVTAGSGIVLKASGGTYSTPLAAGDAVFGVTASGSASVAWERASVPA